MDEPQTSEQGTSFFDSSATPEGESEDERVASYFEPPEVEDHAVRITSPAPEAVGDAPRYSRAVGEGDAERFFPARTSEEAHASLAAIAGYCSNCPISDHCPEERCAVYRAEATALRVADGEGRTAVAGVVIPAQPGVPS